MEAVMKPKILCADSDDDTAEMLTTLLSLSNYEVIRTKTVRDSLRLAQCEDFNLHLLDIWYTDGCGIELCKRIREFDPLTPIVFYTTDVYEQNRQLALESGAQSYLLRPDNIVHLMSAVEHLITRTAPLEFLKEVKAASAACAI
jgi:DNA-binding response OmpR family regulator